LDALTGPLMEVYYKDLISEDASLDKLVDDLTRVMQGAEEFAAEAVAGVELQRRREIYTHLARMRASCRRFGTTTAQTARAAQRAARQHPLIAAGLIFGAGMLVGALWRRRHR
jgi:ElaB/YqjD/DUF883 family membrane-anchored ribosome-binding protein